jgi:translation initiation factor 1A
MAKLPKKNKDNVINEQDKFVRVRLPRNNEVIGIITQRLGASRMYVSCMDGKTRNCRVPGSKRRGLWLREGDAVIVDPWEFDNEKADLIYKFSPTEVFKLKSMGKLVTSSEEF